MSLRSEVERAVGLLRQGHPKHALEILERALANPEADTEPPPASDSGSIPLAFDPHAQDSVPTIPEFSLTDTYDLVINDEGWVFPEDVVHDLHADLKEFSYWHRDNPDRMERLRETVRIWLVQLVQFGHVYKVTS